DQSMRSSAPEQRQMPGGNADALSSEEVVELSTEYEIEFQIVVPVRAVHGQRFTAATPNSGVNDIDGGGFNGRGMHNNGHAYRLGHDLSIPEKVDLTAEATDHSALLALEHALNNATAQDHHHRRGRL